MPPVVNRPAEEHHLEGNYWLQESEKFRHFEEVYSLGKKLGRLANTITVKPYRTHKTTLAITHPTTTTPNITTPNITPSTTNLPTYIHTQISLISVNIYIT